jgi:DNA-directed RNA polymerase specialized sigma24 family protein
LDDTHSEIPDKTLDLEGMLVTKQSIERVREILDEMPRKDRDLLRAIFLDEKEIDEVCREFQVDREYLRVLLHRAKARFKAIYEAGLPADLRKETVMGGQ